MRRITMLPSMLAFLTTVLVLFAPMATAQSAVAPLAGLSVSGFGMVNVPAETATVVLILGSGYYGDENPMVETPVVSQISQAEISAPVVEAIAAAGVPTDAIHTVINPYSGDYGPSGGPITIMLVFDLQNPTVDEISDILDDAFAAAHDWGLYVTMAGAMYGVTDCATLMREARQSAIADAREQAALQAELLDVSLGEIIASHDDPYAAMSYGGYGGIPTVNTCTTKLPLTSVTTLYSVPLFDPGIPAEVSIVTNVNLTFEILPLADVTPAS